MTNDQCPMSDSEAERLLLLIEWQLAKGRAAVRRGRHLEAASWLRLARVNLAKLEGAL